MHVRTLGRGGSHQLVAPTAAALSTASGRDDDDQLCRYAYATTAATQCQTMIPAFALLVFFFLESSLPAADADDKTLKA